MQAGSDAYEVGAVGRPHISPATGGVIVAAGYGVPRTVGTVEEMIEAARSLGWVRWTYYGLALTEAGRQHLQTFRSYLTRRQARDRSGGLACIPRR